MKRLLILSHVDGMQFIFKTLGFQQREEGWMLEIPNDNERHPIHDWLEASEEVGILTWVIDRKESK